MPAQCKLLLDNYTGHYTPGSTILGRVLVNLDSDTTIRGVKVTLTCKEHTSFMGTESYYDSQAREQRTRDTQFTGDRDTFEIKQWLYGDQSNTTSLSAGQHVYPFQMNLQPNIPGTYHCDLGSISYKLRATLDRPLAFDQEDEILLQINSPVDLNFLARPEDLRPVTYSDDVTVCCWCCAQDPITMSVEFPKLTLVAGEQIDVKVYVNNMSNTNVESVYLELNQNIYYKVTEPNTDDHIIQGTPVALSDVGVGAHGENTYIFKVMLPPDFPIPNFTQCGLFSVKYEYRVSARLPKFHNDLLVTGFPKVGHIPLGASNLGSPHPPMGDASVGWVGGPGPLPSAPLLDPKEQEASNMPSNFSAGASDQAPPSYDSLNFRSALN